MKDSPYFPQAALMIRALPAVAAEACFALKGGTAINLFVRDMPRLSVDIDLTYLPTEPRDAALPNIGAALTRIAARLRSSLGAKVQELHADGSDHTTKLLVQSPAGLVKVEPNPVTRGVAFAPAERTLVPAAEALFEQAASIMTVSLPDLYGGKLCAALDRQHSRDLFDVMLLFQNEGITPEIRKALVVSLASHDRPIHELLAARKRNIRDNFKREFQGMTSTEVTPEDLEAARDRMCKELLAGLTNDERRFLLSLKQGEPKWELLGVDAAANLPAIQWKLMNIRRMAPEKREAQSRKLAEVLGLG